MSWWRSRGLRFKLALGIFLVMFLILGGAVAGMYRSVRAQFWDREVRSAEDLNAMAAILLDEAMMAGRKDRIQDALETLGSNLGGQIDSLAVYDDEGLLTSFATGFAGGRDVSRSSLAQELTEPGCWSCHQFPVGERPTMTVVSVEGQDVMRNVVPLYTERRCQTCHGTGKAVLGDSIVDIRLDRYRQASNMVTLGLGGGAILAILLVSVVLYLLIRRMVVSPLANLVTVAEAVTQGDLDRQVQIRNDDEVGQLGVGFNVMTERLRDTIGGLEDRVAKRTLELEQHSAYLEAAADVGRTVSVVLDPDILIPQVVKTIRERFDLYYVGLFLLDESHEWAVLRAGTGEAGRRMLARGHRLRVRDGMVGWAIANGDARIALDVGDDAVRFDNPDLPETRSEAALPLRSRGRVLGALTVQSVEEAAFDQDAIVVLQTMADQVAAALENAQLYARSEEALAAERRAYGEMSNNAWLQTFRARANLGYVSGSAGIQPVDGKWQPESLSVFDSGKTIQADELTLAIPIIFHGEILGAVRLRKAEDAGAWTADEVALMETITDQLGVALESARLFGDSQRRATYEQMTSDISTRLRETLDIETVMRTAAQELRQALSLPEVTIRLGTPTGASNPGGNGKSAAETAPLDDEELIV
jgi:GAF domain-containing protein/HAMP domain-containing protein